MSAKVDGPCRPVPLGRLVASGPPARACSRGPAHLKGDSCSTPRPRLPSRSAYRLGFSRRAAPVDCHLADPRLGAHVSALLAHPVERALSPSRGSARWTLTSRRRFHFVACSRLPWTPSSHSQSLPTPPYPSVRSRTQLISLRARPLRRTVGRRSAHGLVATESVAYRLAY